MKPSDINRKIWTFYAPLAVFTFGLALWNIFHGHDWQWITLWALDFVVCMLSIADMHLVLQRHAEAEVGVLRKQSEFDEWCLKESAAIAGMQRDVNEFIDQQREHAVREVIAMVELTRTVTAKLEEI